MPDGSAITRAGVRVIQGTPTESLTGATLFLRLWRTTQAGGPERTRAALLMARPGPHGYLIKELIQDMELDPHAALDKAVAIAHRGGVARIYVNADLAKLPAPQRVAGAAGTEG